MNMKVKKALDYLAEKLNEDNRKPSEQKKRKRVRLSDLMAERYHAAKKKTKK